MKVTNVNLWRCWSEVLKVRLWPKIVKQALRSAHWTSSPRGPPLSTMAWKCCPAVPARAPGYSNTYRSRVQNVMMGRTFLMSFQNFIPSFVWSPRCWPFASSSARLGSTEQTSSPLWNVWSSQRDYCCCWGPHAVGSGSHESQPVQYYSINKGVEPLILEWIK